MILTKRLYCILKLILSNYCLCQVLFVYVPSDTHSYLPWWSLFAFILNRWGNQAPERLNFGHDNVATSWQGKRRTGCAWEKPVFLTLPQLPLRPVATALDSHIHSFGKYSFNTLQARHCALYTGTHLNFTATMWSFDTAIFILPIYNGETEAYVSLMCLVEVVIIANIYDGCLCARCAVVSSLRILSRVILTI